MSSRKYRVIPTWMRRRSEETTRISRKFQAPRFGTEPAARARRILSPVPQNQEETHGHRSGP